MLIFSISMFIVSFYACVFRSSLRSNFILFLALASAVTDSSAFASSSTAKLSVFEVFKSFPASSVYIYSIIFSLSNKSLTSNYFSFEWPTQWDVIYIFLKKLNRVFSFWFDFLDGTIQVCPNVIGISNHSNTYYLHIYIYLISSSFSCDFLLSFGFLSGGSPLVFFPYTIHHQLLS